MKIKLSILLSIIILFYSCNAQKSNQSKMKDGKKGNRLVDSSSPYLKQHAYNPVDWFPWGDEALDKAKAEDKLIVISVGYAACHWCHVMEHESFEDDSVAKIMNENYVSIKVDREERPDVDQIYMTAAYLTMGRGGWPLNAIALPNGKPIFAGTYYPKDQWLKVLDHFTNMYANDKEKALKAAEDITKNIGLLEYYSFNAAEPLFEKNDLEAMFNKWDEIVDHKKGGRKGQDFRTPKFPMPNNWEYLMKYSALSGNTKAFDIVETTLDQMAASGLYDHVGGGFTRYSVDQDWMIPHFEKMMYDNGQLVSLYSQAYRKTKNPIYKQRVYETLEWVKREMTHKNGGFYSSLDADSDGEEGKYYVWDYQELQPLLGEDFDLYCYYYNITPDGNFEHKNHLHKRNTDAVVAQKFAMSIEDVIEKIQGINQKLYAEREKRVRPGLDDKIITSWNGLMIQGYVEAYRSFGEEEYLEAALKAGNFIHSEQLKKDGSLYRISKDGNSSINGFLDDYSITAMAFIDLYQVTFDEEWLTRAKDLVDYAHEHFYDANSKMYFYTSDLDPELIARKMEVNDNVIPSSNSTLARVYLKLGHYFYDNNYLEMSETMLNNLKKDAVESPAFNSNWGQLMLDFIEEPYEIAIVGPDADAKRAEFDQQYFPNVLLLGGNSEGQLKLLENKLIPDQTTIYVCRNKVCKLPVTEVSEAVKLID